MYPKALIGSILPAALVLSACGGTTDTAGGDDEGTPALDFTIGYAQSTDSYRGQGVAELESYLDENYDGDVKLQVAADSSLGSEADMLEAVQLGTIEMAVLSTPVLVSVLPKLGVFDLPYIWRDLDHFFTVMDGDVGLSMAEDAPQHDFEVVDYWMGGIRNVYGNVRIEEPSDMKGAKVRILQSPVFEATFKAFGASPTPVDWPETYQALQLGTVDAAETALPAMVDAKQYEVSKFAVLTTHAINATAVVVNADWWGQQSQDAQDALSAAIEAGKEVDRRVYLEEEDATLQLLEDEGLEVIEPDLDKFREVAAPVVAQFSDEVGADAIEAVESAGR